MTLPNGDEVDSLRARLTELEAERSTLIDRLERLRGRQSLGNESPAAGVAVTAASTAAEKIALFRRLFSGRTDVFPMRLYVKELVLKNFAGASADQLLERMVELSLYAEEKLKSG